MSCTSSDFIIRSLLKQQQQRIHYRRYFTTSSSTSRRWLVQTTASTAAAVSAIAPNRSCSGVISSSSSSSSKLSSSSSINNCCMNKSNNIFRNNTSTTTTTSFNHNNSIRYFSSSSSSSSNADNYPPHTVLPMPALSPTMESGSIVSFNKEVGDEFIAGDVLCSVETDKANVDFEAQDDGIVAKWLIELNTELQIGTPICIVVDDKSDITAFDSYKVVSKESTTAAITETTTEAETTTTSASTISTATTSGTNTPPSLLMPSARHLAESNGKDATILQGTGKGGRVTKEDVIIALKAGTLPDLIKTASAAPTAAAAATTTTVTAAAPVPATPTTTTTTIVDLPIPTIDTTSTYYEDVPNNKMRKIIASRLTESKRDVPHSYTSMEVSLDEIMKLRKQLQNIHDIKISVNDCIIKCSALALRDVPEVNGTYSTKINEVSYNNSIDISVAVATPTGLITPIVFNTDQLGLAEISDKIKDLATRARDGRLQPHEYQGGTFSISNLGMFGIKEFSAVINPPQAAILAVGGGSSKIIPTPFNPNVDEEEQLKPYIQNTLTGRLSYDRRVVDEATSSLFLQAFQYYMETPELLLL